MTHSRRILIVDDDELTVRTVRRMLEKQGFQVLAAYDGATGLEKAREEKPDLLILDIEMPGMDGYEVCRRLQSDPLTAMTPVLMLTGRGQVDRTGRDLVRGVEERIVGYDAGAVEFLSKPVGSDELVQRVKALLWLYDLET